MVALPRLIERHRDEILERARARGARRLRVFGSAARGDATAVSDLDLLAEFQPGRSLLDLAGLKLDLESLLGVPVDLVSEGGLDPRIADEVHAEARDL